MVNSVPALPPPIPLPLLLPFPLDLYIRSIGCTDCQSHLGLDLLTAMTFPDLVPILLIPGACLLGIFFAIWLWRR